MTTKVRSRASFYFLSIGTKMNDYQKPREFAISLAELLEFPQQKGDIALATRPTYELRVLYGPIKTVVRTATCHFGSVMKVYLIRFSMISEKVHNSARRKKFITLRTATKQPLPLDGLIFLHLRLDELNTRIWFEIAPNLAVDILGTYFMELFIFDISPLKRKIVPLHSQSFVTLYILKTVGLTHHRKLREKPKTTNTEIPAKDKKHGLV